MSLWFKGINWDQKDNESGWEYVLPDGNGSLDKFSDAYYIKFDRNKKIAFILKFDKKEYVYDYNYMLGRIKEKCWMVVDKSAAMSVLDK